MECGKHPDYPSTPLNLPFENPGSATALLLHIILIGPFQDF